MHPTILVTWWLWYIWSHTVVVLLKAWYKIVIIDNCSNSSLDVVDGIEQIAVIRPLLYQWDIGDESLLETIFTDHTIDAVIHFAAKKAVGESMEVPFDYYHNNITGTQNLLRMMDRYSVRNIIFSSTCAVYNPINQPPYTENMSTWPESVYGITKRIDEEMMEWLVLTKKLSACLLRYFNPIGNHPSGIIGESPTQKPQNIMPVIMEVLEWKRDYLTVFGDQYPTRDGSCIRDYIHVMDLAEAHVQALEWLLHQSSPLCEIINLGTWTGTTVLEMIKAVEEALKISLPYKIVDARTGDLPAVFGNCDKAKQLLWRSTKRSLAEGIQDMWKFRNK